MSGVLTAKESARELGYHINHLYELMRNGTIKAQQFNRVWMIPSAEVDRIKALQGPGGRLPKDAKQSIG